MAFNEDRSLRIVSEPMKRKDFFSTDVNSVKDLYHNRWGVDIGEKTKLLVYAKLMTGQR